MLKQRLDEVNAILAKLIALTEEDIENIKVANHESVTPSFRCSHNIIHPFPAERVAATRRPAIPGASTATAIDAPILIL